MEALEILREEQMEQEQREEERRLTAREVIYLFILTNVGLFGVPFPLKHVLHYLETRVQIALAVFIFSLVHHLVIVNLMYHVFHP